MPMSEVEGIAIIPGQEQTAVTFRRAASSDRTLVDWALKPVDRDVVVALLDPRGRPAVSYRLRGARPVAWRGPALDATTTAVALEELVVAVTGIDVR